MPTLVIWGTRDRLVDVRLARQTAGAFPDSRLLVLAGVGHVAQMEAPSPTARAIAALWAGAAAGGGAGAAGGCGSDAADGGEAGAADDGCVQAAGSGQNVTCSGAAPRP